MENNATIDNFTWSAFLKGDKDAYAVIYREYFRRLYNYGMRFTQDITLVEDCIQDLLLNLWAKRNNLENIAGVDSYIFVSFRNNLLYCIKKNPDTINVDNENNYNFELQISIDQVMINAERIFEQQINLREAILTLTQRQKEAVYFKFYENLSYQQIAGILNISTKAAYKLVARSIVGLRSVYKQRIFSFQVGLVLFSACISLF